MEMMMMIKDRDDDNVDDYNNKNNDGVYR